MTVRRLSSGYWHIRGIGPCNWAQVPSWPCSDAELEAGFFAEAGESFRRECREALQAIRARGEGGK